MAMGVDARHQGARQLLKEMLCSRSLKIGAADGYELRSGHRSGAYVDAKLTTCDPEGARLVGRVFLGRIYNVPWPVPQAVGGPGLGANPITMAVAIGSLETGFPISAFMVREDRKGHGTRKLIEGLAEPKPERVVIVDDVCTSGSSTAKAVAAALDSGMLVLGAICLVDREQGAGDLLRKKFGVSLEKIFTLSELVAAAADGS